MKPQGLQGLLLQEVRDIYDAERQLTKALPKMAKAAESPELREAFQRHLEETRNQIKRLEQVFSLLGQTPRGKSCAAMEGLLEEGSEMLELEPEIRDAALIAAAQKVEHYEIASYGCLATWAGVLGLEEVQRLATETLQEEKQTDELLTRIAETQSNTQAVSG
jgi:ferritin-like metal-binding protein YciE